jgi:hypothetical protein
MYPTIYSHLVFSNKRMQSSSIKFYSYNFKSDTPTCIFRTLKLVIIAYNIYGNIQKETLCKSITYTTLIICKIGINVDSLLTPRSNVQEKVIQLLKISLKKPRVSLQWHKSPPLDLILRNMNSIHISLHEDKKFSSHLCLVPQVHLDHFP